MLDQFVVIFFFALFYGIFLTPLIRNYARKKGLVDETNDARKIHDKPIPRIGGVSIFLAFLLSIFSLLALDQINVVGYSLSISKIYHILGLGLCVFFVGLMDDIYKLRPRFKFYTQIFLAVVAFLLGFRIQLISVPFSTTPLALNALSLPVTVLWFVGITNAFNLIDGIDGLSAGLGLIASFIMLFISVSTGHVIVALLSAALAGCLLGFLRYNFHPATIFMGDSGSTFVGFMLAALSITGSQKSSTVIVIFIPFLIMAVPILDTFIAVARRLISGRHIFEADREHIHHKLLDKGLKQSQIAFILYGIAALLGFYSLIFITPSSRYIGYSLLFVFIVLVIAIQKIGYEEFKELFRYVAVGLRFQGKQLSSQIKFRKLFNGGLNNEKGLSLDGVFDKMKNAFDEYGFDSLRLCIEENGSSANDRSFFWKKDNGQHQKDPWEITVPLEFNHDKKAFITLTYANGHDALPMRLSFIVQDLPAILVDTLEKCYDNGASKIKSEVNDKT